MLTNPSRRTTTRPSRGLGWLAVPVTFLLVACTASDPGTTERIDQPEAERLAQRHMVSAAHPAAVQAGLRVLRDGGHAVDAAIAVQMVLSFIEAPETGLGGGGFLLLHESETGTTRMYDGRETAPATATPDRFRTLGVDHPLGLAIPSGSSVGVPGLVAMLGKAHADHGRLPWAELLEPAARLAEDGVPMPPRLRHQIESDWSLRLFADTRRFFRAQIGGESPVLRNPELAATLRQLAAEGPDAFYRGPLAEAIVERVRTARWGKSDMQLSDLANYRPVLRDAVCAPYREWTLCGGAPPSSGGIAVLQMLGILEHFPLAQMSPEDPATLHLIGEASRLAFADRNHYLGDPDRVQIPVEGLLDRDYLARRARLIDTGRAMEQAYPGEPGGRTRMTELSPRSEPHEQGTSHFSIVDGDGNLVALTSSNEAPFGSRMLVHGMVLNNQLTDFTFDPHLDDGQHPNAVGPGKRPRSSMSPFVVLDQSGEPVLVIGSRGGSRIIGYVLKTLIGVLDWKLDIQDAIALPNMVERGQGIELEENTSIAQLADALREMGHEVRVVPMTSGLHGIERVNDDWRGGADPRLDGVARGD